MSFWVFDNIHIIIYKHITTIYDMLLDFSDLKELHLFLMAPEILM